MLEQRRSFFGQIVAAVLAGVAFITGKTRTAKADTGEQLKQMIRDSRKDPSNYATLPHPIPEFRGPLRVGEQVVLNSGGPLMRVESVDGEEAVCSWDGDEDDACDAAMDKARTRDTFHLVCLSRLVPVSDKLPVRAARIYREAFMLSIDGHLKDVDELQSNFVAPMLEPILRELDPPITSDEIVFLMESCGVNQQRDNASAWRGHEFMKMIGRIQHGDRPEFAARMPWPGQSLAEVV